MKNINNIYKNNTIYNYDLSELSLIENKIEGNLKADLVVFYSTDDNNDLLAIDQRNFLYKMLGAVKHNLENTLIISDKSKISFKQLIKEGNFKKIMLFGTTRKTVGLNLNLKRYKIFKIQNVEILFIDDLETIKGDNKRKSFLWSLMKTMFSIE